MSINKPIHETLIGWASISITPDKPVVLCGQFHARISQKVNDPIMATALAIETAEDQAIMISCDLVFIDKKIQSMLRQLVKDKMPGFDVNKIFINGTHTHTGPNMIEDWYAPQGKDVMSANEYVDFLVERLSQLVMDVWENRKPGGVSWALSHAVVGHNRRAVYLDGTARMYGATNTDNFDCIEGYEDHSLNLIFLWDEYQKLTGIVINISCPSQVTEGEYYLSADFWHEVRMEVRKRYSEDIFVITQCSAAGDQSPHFLLFGQAEADMRKRKGVTEREEIAIKVANGIDYVFPYAKSQIVYSLPFRHTVQEISLPMRKVTDKELEQAKAERDSIISKGISDNNSGEYMILGRNKCIIERYEEQKTNPFYRMEFHVLRLGDIAIATNPFEMYLDFAMRIKARSRALQTFVVQLACDCVGYFGASYLPTAKAVAGGGYGAEIASNLVGPEGGQMLVNETVKLINKMWD